jgi:hypothetical protein
VQAVRPVVYFVVRCYIKVAMVLELMQCEAQLRFIIRTHNSIQAIIRTHIIRRSLCAAAYLCCTCLKVFYSLRSTVCSEILGFSDPECVVYDDVRMQIEHEYGSSELSTR